MVRYNEPEAGKISVAVRSITGATGANVPDFQAWQPSTWQQTPRTVDEQFIDTLRTIFNDSILGEIDNVIGDVQKSNGDLRHRGHVVAIGLLCALDAISYYGYGASDRQIPQFVNAHFPAEYREHGTTLRNLYRHTMVHHWNLFRAALTPGNEPIREENGVLSFGLLHFRDALRGAAENFLQQLKTDVKLKSKTLRAYNTLRGTARA